MQFLNLLSFFVFHFSLLITGHNGVLASSHHHHGLRQRHKPYSKLFVFGDSYADTGNNRKTLAPSWKEPYGITFPGKPSGRFSDGRILTDYIAKYLGLRSPIPYRWMKYGGKRLSNGINFAYGGSGVFQTLVFDPNMTTQIDFFEKLINNNHLYTKRDLNSSFVLVTLSGNDYVTYFRNGGTPQGLPNYIPVVVNQLVMNLKRIHGLGAKKIGVATLPPLGCHPRRSIQTSFQKCIESDNAGVTFHNSLLQQAVAKLNYEANESAFFVLDIDTSFKTILDHKGDQTGILKLENPLKGCCMGTSPQYSCGSVNEKGEKMYTVCNNPNSFFFWDDDHPTQVGWQAVINALTPTLQKNIYQIARVN